MAVFIGTDAASVAAQTALNITWVVETIVHEQLKDHVDKYFDAYIETSGGSDIGRASTSAKH
ncbi:hypothetical protein GTA09_29375 [Rhodococcus hoagii]|nr:hypothetical protein [Prescottella equi]